MRELLDLDYELTEATKQQIIDSIPYSIYDYPNNFADSGFHSHDDLTETETDITVNADTTGIIDAGDVIKIEDERMLVTANDFPPVLLATRGYEGTTPTTHASGLEIYVRTAFTRSLVLFCPALQGRGATLIDRSQSANHGTITGATWRRLPSGLRVNRFAGVSDVITLGTAGGSLSITGSQSYEGWVYWDNTGTSDYPCIYCKTADNGSDGHTIYVLKADSTLHWHTLTDTQSYDDAMSSAITPLTWTHFLLVFDQANTRKVGVVNGTTVTVNGRTGNMTTSTNAGRLGFRAAGVVLKGDIGLFRAYAEARTTSRYTRERHLFGV
jgi:hypothetical protein